MNYMIIRVKEKSLNKEKQKEQRKEERNEQEKEKNAQESKGFGDSLLDHDSLVEVGYGLYYLIVNS